MNGSKLIRYLLSGSAAVAMAVGCANVLGINDYEKSDEEPDASGGSGGKCTPPVEGVCDNKPQCGCASRENCVITTDSESVCVPAGNAAPYAGCGGTEDCSKGYDCISGACKAMCEDATDQCEGEGARCFQINNDGTPVSGAYACSRTCNPARPGTDDANFKPCGANTSCFASGTASDCFGPPDATGTQGVACEDVFDCARGFGCFEDTGTCMKWCQIGGTDCPNGTTCTATSPRTNVAGTEFGRCVQGCTPPVKGTCDTAPLQCGCGNGQRCDITALDGTTGCFTSGTVQPYNNCGNAAGLTCQAGYACIGSACKRLCNDATSSCGAPAAKCTSVKNGTTPIPGYFFCPRLCDPTNPATPAAGYSACGPLVNCYPTEDGISDCVGNASAAGIQGVSCAAASDAGSVLNYNACAPGFYCLESTLKCQKMCRVGAATGCGSGLTCRSFPTKYYANTVEIGYCG